MWLYFRFTLSFRDVEDLLSQRGIEVSYETVRCWTIKFGPAIARNLKRSRPRPSPRWHLDEMVSSIGGKRVYLWRAVDDEGEVLDVIVQQRRDIEAALKLLKRLLRNQPVEPEVIVTDGLASYGSALFPGVYGIDSNGNVRAMAPGLTPLTPASYTASILAQGQRQLALGSRRSGSTFNAYDKRESLYLINTTTVDLTQDVQLKAIVGLINVKEDQASNFGGDNSAGFLACHSNCGDGATQPFVAQRQYSGELRPSGKALDHKLTWSADREPFSSAC